ncbi:hypothetical protein [Planctomyces sp. SH-PL62]|uniref:hypothetical protein n=1 Tax=Planctomyces sp. SH-PL62 TaxID=1636152 RepID=UPI00078EB6DB|nr:hypothetical protein [Planctomyces sp. SH-PL62]AMV36145.1 hypothetical protein VT85_01785 [Planctomyces sp. SH-PL62]
MTILYLVALVGWQGAAPGPIESFRANFAAIGAEGDYEYRSGRLPSELFEVGAARLKDAVTFADEEPRVISGSWASYGGVEWFLQDPPTDSAGASAGARSGASASSRDPGPGLELLSDGWVVARLDLGEADDAPGGTIVEASYEPTGGVISRAKGPFVWWECSLSAMLALRFDGATPELGRLELDGAPLEVETYIKPNPSGWVKMEVAYDPRIGFLPRRTRFITLEGKKAYVREWRLVDHRRSDDGGVVPLEWISGLFQYDDFVGSYPSYDASTKLRREEAVVGGSHFRLTSFRNRHEPTALTHLTGRVTLACAGGEKRLGGTPARLTLADVRQSLGRGLTRPVRSPPPISVDLEERDRFSQPRSGRSWTLPAMLLAAGLSGFILVWKLRTHRAAL